MTPSSTIYKVELQVTDMDRHYYAVHTLTNDQLLFLAAGITHDVTAIEETSGHGLGFTRW